MSKRILWLIPPKTSDRMLSVLKRYIQKSNVDLKSIEFAAMTNGCWKRKPKTKNKFEADMARAPQFHTKMASKTYDIIVANDKAALFYLTGKYSSLAICRGGVYKYKGKPVLVFDDTKKIMTTRTGGWITLQDLGKLSRWANGTFRKEPAFNYRVCHTVDDVKELLTSIETSILSAIDIETTGTTISCIGYSNWTNEGKSQTFVIPFYNTLKPGGCHWETAEEEEQVWSLVGRVHDSSTYKVMQNGSYDSTYFVTYGVPLRNYYFDTLHMWHSIWAEAPKSLAFIASIAMDFIRYWKDEGKEDAEDTKGYAVPTTARGLSNYWLYNALDCHGTLMGCKFLSMLLCNTDWALRNYTSEFTRQFGVNFNMSMRGVKVNNSIHQQLMSDMWDEHQEAEKDLLLMVADQDFNANSPKQVQELIYDVLGAKEIPRKGRVTGETELKMIATQDPLLEIIISQIWATKKPANNVSKYSQGKTLHGRFMYKLYTAGTPTGRLTSKAHDLWVGSNIQNKPKRMRVQLEADRGYVIVDADYAQSDAYFTAFESGDPAFIATMMSGKDTHCVHAEQFFKQPYDKLLEATAAGEDWAVHPTKGVRQITKRVVYGANYFMHAFTLFLTMGKESVVAAAHFLGYEEAHTWDFPQLVKFCEKELLEVYYEMYPEIKLSIPEEAQKAVRNGNKASAAFGYTRVFFGDLVNDDKVQREFAAFFGQGGTAGNVNKALETIFWELESQGVELLFQVHDSIIFQVPETKLHLIPLVMAAMENTVTIKGREFVVPVDAQVGRGWGKRLMNWKPDITLGEIDKNELAWQTKWAQAHNKGVAA